MKKYTIQAVNTERDFNISELFFSTTDDRGVITSGNKVFIDVSGYTWKDLAGQPHNIIRHPDMPRCVFKLLWDYLEDGKSIAAYVKNMAKDGCFYWVLALVCPIDGGYLSIRLKPTSDIFSVVKKLYGELLKVEKEFEVDDLAWRDGMQESTKKLNLALAQLGFANYDAFMHAALREELKSREKNLKTVTTTTSSAEVKLEQTKNSSLLNRIEEVNQIFSVTFNNLDHFVEINERLHQQSKKIFEAVKTVCMLSLNVSINSLKFGTIGRPLAMVSNIMQGSAAQIEISVKQVTEVLTSFVNILKGMIFDLASGKLQVEMLSFYVKELLHSSGDGQDASEIIRQLQEVLMETVKRRNQQSQQCMDLLSRISNQADDLEKGMKTIQLSHQAGKVEATRAGVEGVFEPILKDMYDQISATKDQLGLLLADLSAFRKLFVVTNESNSQISKVLDQMESQTTFN